MTDEQIERLAELVFQKLLEKQKNWEDEINNDIYTELAIPNSVHIATQIAVAESLLDKYVAEENYFLASELQKTIKILVDKLENKD